MNAQAFILLYPTSEFDSHFVTHLLSQKHPLLLINASAEVLAHNPEASHIQLCAPLSELNTNALLDWFEINNNQQEVMVLHCANRLDESNLLEDIAVGEQVIARLESAFSALRVIADNLRVSGGNLVFLTQSDTLNYELEATASVCNHAHNALMMTLAREYQGSKLAVNSFVLPLLATDSKAARIQKRNLKGGVLGARPAVYSYQDLVEYLVNFMKTNSMLTGQSIAFTPTLELKL
ncbi:hypothetical protein CWB89_20285 [Pseudoalteromonas piscicida]|uniref:Uncharacterized protein n=1 Tax=Pseudoalteromonas piscicida TaxID=43662 RepID=A0AAQ2IQF1_PSEO7|nr:MULTISPECIES: hypothetical protein [Pseudoalteromonas]KJY86465.1 hypothetical protein TW75_17010 [Pseudoalteromonas piscicida]MDP4488655.1 hypothetical protein [Pseudoalteromonas piscicida]TMN34246.1 hypothetical protein CWB94_22780 [Pseudoalteromonas piscicida]TMN37567.1 hypothetical protein CWB95_15235 [Pseudoalteromonas piscicida]TMN49116.1 hypothetical protein CWB92_16215 [Pseudoalteromonas piscicida]